jgi:iron complex outermembrane recepter protein
MNSCELSKIRPVVVVGALLGSCLAAPMALSAEGASPAGQSADNREYVRTMRVEEIIVTAQKRAQSIDDVPMSVSAVTGAQLEQNGEKSFTDYAQSIPGLNFGSLGEGQNRINLRGMQGITGAATVAYFVDGVSQGFDTGSPDNELFDVNRVEVLRGPQGTLYGEGAVGGAIKIETNAPDPREFAGRVQVSYSQNAEDAAQQGFNGMLNVPLITDQLALRLVGYKRETDGYIQLREPDFTNPAGFGFTDYSSQTIVARDGNDGDLEGGRVALAWTPSDSFSMTARYNVQRNDLGASTSVSPSLEPQYGQYNQTQGLSSTAHDSAEQRYDQGSLNIRADFGAVSLESITGYASIETRQLLPSFIVADLGGGFVIGDMFSTDLLNDDDIFTQELRLASTADGPLTWTVGAFYKDVDSRAVSHQMPGPNFRILDPNNDFQLDSTLQIQRDNQEYAVYGQAEYAFADRWSAIVGARYYEADLRMRFGENDIKPSFDDFSPKVGLSYHYSPDVLFYTTIARGFRVGGVNVPTINPPPNDFSEGFDPDHVLSYEVGVNSVLAGGRLRADAAVFYARWEDMQQEILVENDNGQQQAIVANAGRAHSSGVEAEITALLPAYLTLSLGGAYLDSELDEDAVNPNVPGGFVPSGTRLENVPKFSGSISLSQEYPVSNNLLLASSLNATHRGETHAAILDIPGSTSDAYTLVNLRIGVRQASGAWDVSLFANNVFDKTASAFDLRFVDTRFLLPARTIGVRGSVSF